jgi:hypothetical protein
MSTTRTMGISVTDVDTEAKLPLGFQYREPASGDKQGEKVWVYVFNDDTNPLAAGLICYRDPSAATEDYYGTTIAPATNHQAKVMCIGVAQHAIAAGSYGFILKEGVGTIKAGSAGLTVDTPFTTGGSAAGTALDYADDTAGANIGVIGHTAAAIAGAATGSAWISCG